MSKKTIEIEVPEGHELIKTDKGYEVVPVKRKNGSFSLIKPIDEKNPLTLVKTEAGLPIAYIADGLAPYGLEHRCIALSKVVDWEFTQNLGMHILIPTTK